jgi:hypothetical protein
MSLLMAQFINKRANNESIPNESRVNHGPQIFFFLAVEDIVTFFKMISYQRVSIA